MSCQDKYFIKSKAKSIKNSFEFYVVSSKTNEGKKMKNYI